MEGTYTYDGVRYDLSAVYRDAEGSVWRATDVDVDGVVPWMSLINDNTDRRQTRSLPDVVENFGPLIRAEHNPSTTRVGDVELPELPPGWMVYVDTEGSGLYSDGDPIPAGSRAAQPEARVSVVSVSFRQPNPDGTPGDRVDYAWPFDQGPLIGKPGTPVKDPETGVCTFTPIDKTFQAKMLAKSSEVLGRKVTLADAAPNLPATEYAKLIAWIDRRDFLGFHNSVHDMHTFRSGLRAGAGGDPSVRDGDYAWDPDSEPGMWVPGQPQRLHMMEPTLEPLANPANNRRSIWCTMVTQKQLIDPLQPAALKPTARRLWGEDATEEEAELKAELSKQGTGLTKRYDLLPWCGSIGRYAAADTALGHRLYEYQLECAEAGTGLPRFWQLHQAEMDLRTTLYRMERRGVAYARDESWAEGERLRELNRELAATMPFDPSKVSQGKRFFFGPRCSRAGVRQHGDKVYPAFCKPACPECGGKNGLGLEPTARTEKLKDPKLDLAEVRDRLVPEGHPWAAEYLTWTKRRNGISKWYVGWAARTGRDGRIRTSFKQCKNDKERAGSAEGGTKSGRLAVGRWQAQAIPHGHLIPEGATPVRRLIGQVPAGTEVVRHDGRREVTPVRRIQYEHDLAAGEIRVVTVIANSTRLWDALDAGADTHAMNTEALFGVDKSHPHFKDLRNAAKRATFGILYGGGVTAIHTQVEAASGMKFSRQAVAEAKDRFFKTYPEFKQFADQAEQRVTRWMGGCGYLKMLDGWRRWYAPEERSTSAVNQVIQGNLARAMIYWMLEIERRIPGCLLLQIHDSLVTEHDDTPEGAKEAQLVSDIGNEVFKKYFGVRGRVMDFKIAPDKWDEKD